MIKIVLSFSIFISAILTSREICKADEKKVALFKELYSIVDEMIGMLRFQSADVYQICNICFENKYIFDFKMFKNINFSFSENWEKACNETFKHINIEAYDYFLEVGRVLGNFDAETQITRLEYISESIKQRYSALIQQYLNKKKIYYAFGAFVGVIICIFLL